MKIVNDYQPVIAAPGGNVTLCAVLTQDATGLYAVYLAANCTPDFAAARGSKQNLRQAQNFYPNFLTEENYRA